MALPQNITSPVLARALSLRGRLLAAFGGVVLIALIIFGTASAQVAGDGLMGVVGAQLNERATEKAGLVGQLIHQPVTSLQVMALNQNVVSAVTLSNLQYPTGEDAIQQRLAALDAEWAVAANESGLISSRVRASPVAEALRDYRDLAPDNVELIVADGRGGLVAATERTSDYNQGDERWWQAARGGQVFISQPALDASAGTMALLIAVPILNPSDSSVIGVARATYRFDALAEQITSIRVGTTGRATLLLGNNLMLDERGRLAKVGVAARESFSAASAAPYVHLTLDGRPRLVSVAPVARTPAIDRLGWRLAFYQDDYEVLAPLQAARGAQALAALVSLLGAGALALLVAGRISAPLTRLSAAARGIAEGDLSRRTGLQSEDEIGHLARSFDGMAAALEQRIRSEQAAQAERLRLQDEVIRVQRDTLRELATPLIPIGDEVLLLPLVGSVDRERAEQIFAALLHGVAARRARRVVIDLTGIPSLDDQVAATLLRAAQGVRLIGAEVTLTGISASLASTLVGLDLDLDALAICASLESALLEHREG